MSLTDVIFRDINMKQKETLDVLDKKKHIITTRYKSITTRI